jgi:hypothetical protein
VSVKLVMVLVKTDHSVSYDTPLETGHFKPTKRYHVVP